MVSKNYIEAFNNLAKELARHSKVELLGYHTFSPLHLQEIEALEAKYNCQLDEAIRTFYTQTNGLQMRWMLKSNPYYQTTKYPPFHRSTAPVAWDYVTDDFEKEDGCVFLLPLEEVLRKVVSPNVEQQDVIIDKKKYSPIDFYAGIRSFDCFSYYCNMALFLRKGQAPLVFLGDEMGTCYLDSRPTNFATYLDFVLASKAVCARRKTFFGQPKGYQEALLEFLPTKLQQHWTLERLVLSQEFALADRLGSSTRHIKSLKMQEKAYHSPVFTREALDETIRAHHEFLNAGGLGGHWQLITIQGRTLGIYKSGAISKGKQAILDMRRIDSEIELQEIYLPYSSWCGVYAKNQDFSDANLIGSLLTDANLERAIFAEATLENVDFSRSNLKGASFMNANLRGADFENCNLTGADFRGAVLTGSQFRGAILKDVLR
ncbi:pentapeptide repeat-containing protein [Aureispira anguillae]|uniref:Pentapeptide repeat-containing protein n=1 Tax=Aureispira anguillae TaxID=2864201 RepID=A0A915YIS2_9BACT|nr:pentapeptide repeat-containing protein [Aureispira anguillae]BDS13934.1 pentapeptide repeat-containing protein [Aureispira anguillae]